MPWTFHPTHALAQFAAEWDDLQRRAARRKPESEHHRDWARHRLDGDNE